MNIALILSGGNGSRLGSAIPKQYIEVNGKPIIGYCLDTFQKNEFTDKIQIVADESYHSYIKNYCIKNDIGKLCGFSRQGESRQLSILNGLKDIIKYAKGGDIVIIHDAARPFVSSKLITESINAVNDEYDGVLPVLPMKDTIYQSNDAKSISNLIDRKTLFAGQAPETFKLGKYYNANLKLLPQKILEINGSTEPAILDNMKIKLINGDENNFKITTMSDFERFKNMENNLHYSRI